jgi:hypothetical protein
LVLLIKIESKNGTNTSTPNLTYGKIYGFNPIIETKYAFVEHLTNNSFLNISCIGLIIRELQLQILLMEKYMGVIPFRILLMEKYMGVIPLLNRMVRKNRTSSSTTNRENAKIRELQLRILLMEKFMGLIPLLK